LFSRGCDDFEQPIGVTGIGGSIPYLIGAQQRHAGVTAWPTRELQAAVVSEMLEQQIGEIGVGTVLMQQVLRDHGLADSSLDVVSRFEFPL
jgi:hypothetical protein